MGIECGRNISLSLALRIIFSREVMYVQRNIEARSPKSVATEKHKCYIFWVY